MVEVRVGFGVGVGVRIRVRVRVRVRVSRVGLSPARPLGNWAAALALLLRQHAVGR
jgi:hypothetical protein